MSCQKNYVFVCHFGKLFLYNIDNQYDIFGLSIIIVFIQKQAKKADRFRSQPFARFRYFRIALVWIASSYLLAMTRSVSYERSHSAFRIHNSAFKITSSRPFRHPWASEVWEV